MTNSSTAWNGHAPPNRGRSAAAWLGYAAAPTFGLMACLSAAAPFGNPICSSGSGPLSIDAMASMYLLMSLFHSPPWLRLASRRSAGRSASPTAQGD